MWELQMFMWIVAFRKHRQEGSAPWKTCGFLTHPLQMHRSGGPSGWQAVRQWWVLRGSRPDFTAVFWSVRSPCQYYMLERNRPLCVCWYVCDGERGILHTLSREQLMWVAYLMCMVYLFKLYCFYLTSKKWFNLFILAFEATATRF